MTRQIEFRGSTPYVYYDDAAAMADWLTRVFGFEESRRHRDGEGRVRNVELRAGQAEVWLDGMADHRRSANRPPEWIGVWVDDVDAMYERVRAAGARAEPPEDKPYGVRMLNVTDPEGVTWGFMRRS